MRILKQAAIFSVNNHKKGKSVNIRVLTGSLSGKEFKAQKTEEIVNNATVNCYYVTNNDVKTYFLEKDIVEI